MTRILETYDTVSECALHINVEKFRKMLKVDRGLDHTYHLYMKIYII